MIYECNGLEVEEKIIVFDEKITSASELLVFLDKHFFNIKASYKATENNYDDLNLGYNTREYDDYQEEDGYENYYEEEEYSNIYNEYEQYNEEIY
ncbi:MAG: hypothetical protein ACRCTZ_03665 [Sarcina sp.]